MLKERPEEPLSNITRLCTVWKEIFKKSFSENSISGCLARHVLREKRAEELRSLTGLTVLGSVCDINRQTKFFKAFIDFRVVNGY